MARILLVSDVIPFPPRNGKELPVAKHFEYLSQSHHIEFLLLHEDEMYFTRHKPDIPTSFKKAHFLRRHLPTKVKGVVLELLFGKIRSLQYRYDKSKVQSFMAQNKYDFFWLGTFNCFSFIDYCIKKLKYSFNKVGLSLHDVKTSSYRNAGIKYLRGNVRDLQTLQRYLRSPLMKKQERRVLNACDVIHVVSESERLKAEKLVGNSDITQKIIVLPNGIDQSLIVRSYKGYMSNVLLFMTHLHGSRQTEARWFLRKVWPKIRANSDLELWFVGAPPRSHDKFDDERIKIKGFVKDLGEILEKVCISILPIFHNCGYINRLHDAMAAGVPVVLTSYPASTAPDLVDGEEIVIANSPEHFAEAVVNLYNDENRRLEISKSGKRYCAQQSNWNELSVFLSARISAELD